MEDKYAIEVEKAIFNFCSGGGERALYAILNTIQVGFCNDMQVWVPVEISSSMYDVSKNWDELKAGDAFNANEPIDMKVQHILENDQGQYFIPVFTSYEELNKGQATQVINQSLNAVFNEIENSPQCLGCIINPWDKSFKINRDLINAIRNQTEMRIRPVYQSFNSHKKLKKKTKIGIGIGIAVIILFDLFGFVLSTYDEEDFDSNLYVEQETSNYSKGSFDDLVYTNEWADIEFCLPEGFSDADSASYSEVNVFNSECGGYFVSDDDLSVIQFFYENIQDTGISDEEEYLKVGLKQLEKLDDVIYQIPETYDYVEIAGNSYVKTEATYSNRYGEFVHSLCVRKLDNYMIVISVLGVDTVSNDALINKITNVK